MRSLDLSFRRLSSRCSGGYDWHRWKFPTGHWRFSQQLCSTVLIDGKADFSWNYIAEKEMKIFKRSCRTLFFRCYRGRVLCGFYHRADFSCYGTFAIGKRKCLAYKVQYPGVGSWKFWWSLGSTHIQEKLSAVRLSWDMSYAIGCRNERFLFFA